MIRRYTASVAPATAITAALCLLMQYMIVTGTKASTPAVFRQIVDFVRVERTPPPSAERERPPRPPEAVLPPDPTSIDDDSGGPEVQIVDPVPPEFGTPQLDGLQLADGDALPLFRVAPDYPMAAIRQALEGHVIVSFTILRSGAVGSVVVVESTHSVFERAAMEAAAKFRYKPRVIDGETVEVHGVRTRISFKLEGK